MITEGPEPTGTKRTLVQHFACGIPPFAQWIGNPLIDRLAARHPGTP
jgi:hypothetical protein